MAGQQSFKKKENEKKKQAKRLEKQKRKEERQAGGKSSMDDMIAWVDENGNITNVPPEERELKKTIINPEEIAVSTPKREDIEEEPLKGRVEYFNSDKGYGFIKDITSTEKYFFHVSGAPAGIAAGDMVSFELERSARGMNAVKITLTK
jgi:cold shock CspA family protein